MEKYYIVKAVSKRQVWCEGCAFDKMVGCPNDCNSERIWTIIEVEPFNKSLQMDARICTKSGCEYQKYARCTRKSFCEERTTEF